MKLRLFGALICLAISGYAVTLVFAQTQLRPIAPSTVNHRIQAIKIYPLEKSAFVEIEFLNLAGEPIEKRMLTLKAGDYPTYFVRDLLAAIEAGLQLKGLD